MASPACVSMLLPAFKSHALASPGTIVSQVVREDFDYKILPIARYMFKAAEYPTTNSIRIGAPHS